MDSIALVKDTLKKIISNRQEELSSLHELNSFSYEDDMNFSNVTEEYIKAYSDMDNMVSKDDYLRLAADFENFKKREIRDKKNIIKITTKEIILDMLRVYDDIERVVKELSKNEEIDNIQMGIVISLENFDKALVAEGCEKINCSLGDKFDVNIMEAIGVRNITDDEKYDVDSVVEIYQSGWKFDGILLRPVKVIVGK